MAACLLCVGTALATQGHYTVKKGDSISSIANRLGVNERQLLRANDLSKRQHLRVGRRLIVPSSEAAHQHASAGGSIYKVKPGDSDDRIAERFHLSKRQLHKLNPDIRWSALQIGRKIHVSESNEGGLAFASTKSVSHHAVSGSYIVRKGDNDLRIARKLGISDRALRLANQHVDWDALQIGHKLAVPGGATAQRQSREISTHYASISKDNVNVRRAPRTSAELIATIDEGTKVTVLDHDGDWYKVRFPRGTKGWVRGDFLVATHVTARISRHSRTSRYVARNDRPLAHANGDVLLTAKSLLGVPYRYGGNSRHGGLDCSAFTSTVYKSHGVNLPRTSREQSSVGRSIPRSQLRAGDLVFFRTGRSSRINHVAIYEGNGKFIHASSGGGEVKESSLNEGYYDRRFVEARRVANPKATSKKSPATVVAKATHKDLKHSTESDEG